MLVGSREVGKKREQKQKALYSEQAKVHVNNALSRI